MSRASRTRAPKRKRQSQAKSSVTTRHVAGTSGKPRAVAKRARATATSADDLPGFLLVTEEQYFESPDSDFDDNPDSDELG